MNSTACTQCKQPLSLDSSLVDLAPTAYDLIAGSLPPSPHQAPYRYLPEQGLAN
ncbi:hypothetical protein JB92DRAFT_2768343 [Gautieria morchelliformis]|nr:hypothetical protein JB92DRAFT_2768343 [Gautieria morchelliformis]